AGARTVRNCQDGPPLHLGETVAGKPPVKQAPDMAGDVGNEKTQGGGLVGRDGHGGVRWVLSEHGHYKHAHYKQGRAPLVFWPMVSGVWRGPRAKKRPPKGSSNRVGRIRPVVSPAPCPPGHRQLAAPD